MKHIPDRFVRLCLLAVVLINSVGCSTSAKPGAGEKLSLPLYVFLVRHTEREPDGEDPPLTAAGEAGLINLRYGAAENISPRCRLMTQSYQNCAEPTQSLPKSQWS